MERKTQDLAGELTTLHQNQRGEEMNFLTFVLSNGVIDKSKQAGRLKCVVSVSDNTDVFKKIAEGEGLCPRADRCSMRL